MPPGANAGRIRHRQVIFAQILASEFDRQASILKFKRGIDMSDALKLAPAGTLIAIGITTSMDATGFSLFSSLPLIALNGLFWYLQKFTRAEIGLCWGDLKSHSRAIGYPLLVLGLAAAIAGYFGAIDTRQADWTKVMVSISLGSLIGILMMITEEGFFRGWLWASLKRAGKSDRQVLIIDVPRVYRLPRLCGEPAHRLRSSRPRNPYLYDKWNNSWPYLGHFTNDSRLRSGARRQSRRLERD